MESSYLSQFLIICIHESQEDGGVFSNSQQLETYYKGFFITLNNREGMRKC